jgi:leucyl-tRNA synthetase
VAQTVEVPVQVNGKLRARLQVPAETSVEELERLAREAVAEHLAGKETKKVVVVPARMVSLVV